MSVVLAAKLHTTCKHSIAAYVHSRTVNDALGNGMHPEAHMACAQSTSTTGQPNICVQGYTGVAVECLRIQIAVAPVKEATVSTKHPVNLAVLILAEEQ